MTAVILSSLTKMFDRAAAAVDGINLNIASGEFIVLVGPSGCGKSTTLRMIAGLEDATSGDIIIGDRRVNDIQARDRDIAMVFQNYALYPHMTVEKNIGFSLSLKGMPKAEIAKRVREVSASLDMQDLLDRYPRQLSGGQRQRVAMGRAIIRNPKVFLFDEPLSNLDAKLRVQMRLEIKRLHQRLRATTIYVTHDQVEAMTLADRVVVMNSGRIEQVGAPTDLYRQPATRFVASFIGAPTMSFLRGTLEPGQERVRLDNGAIVRLTADAAARNRHREGAQVELGVRPEHVYIAPLQRDVPSDDLTSEVAFVEPLGQETLVYLALETIGSDIGLCARLPGDASPQPGDRVSVSFAPGMIHLFDPHSQAAL